MDTELLDRHLPSRTSLPSRDGEDEAPVDLGAFGYLRGIRDRAIMLELRCRNGNVVAFQYQWLERADFNPSDGIVLKFGVTTVKVTGRNLNANARPNVRLFDGIVRHRVPWIQEADQQMAMTASKGSVLIEAIKVS